MRQPESDRLLNLIERIGNLIRREGNGLFGGLDLHPVHIQILAYLSRANGYSDTPKALREYLGTTEEKVSKSLQILRENGLVSSTRDANDGRVVHLSPTAVGYTALGRLDEEGIWPWVCSQFPDYGALTDLLADFLTRLQQAHAERTFGECRSCRYFHTVERDRFCCERTGLPLTAEDASLICREHVPLGAASG